MDFQTEESSRSRILVWAKYLILVGFVVISSAHCRGYHRSRFPVVLQIYLSKRNTRRRNPAFIDQRAFTSGCRFSLPVEIRNPGVSSYLIGIGIPPILQIHLSVGRSVQPFQPYRTLSVPGAGKDPVTKMRQMSKSLRHGHSRLGNT